MIIECDDAIPENMVNWLQDLDGMIKITSYNTEEAL